ncbi:MAG: hypothetical protein J5955_03315 [Bacilli bacterium]|nr:hypothetical protein [Bacilli bacterium]
MRKERIRSLSKRNVYSVQPCLVLTRICEHRRGQKEERILVLRYGLDGLHTRTLAEVAKEFGIGREKRM